MRRNGFTLIELAIVLAIIGLLVGGILAGQSMIRNSEVKSVITESTKYLSAMREFRDKYSSWPGDIPDATNYWGTKAGTGNDVTCYNTAGTGRATCNGNGNGFMESGQGGDITAVERFLAWQHLSAAGLIEGQYSGASASTTGFLWNSVNVPQGTVARSIWFPHALNGTFTGDPNWFDGTYPGNVLVFGGSGYPLNPEEAWNVDTKLDDGKPSTGKIFSYKSTSAWGPNCANTDVVNTAEYNVTNSGKTCNLLFWIQ
jgi:prepilin-type N-terminal cleavage/methylation domain-containing protein